jgi:hypothetical protein
MSEELGTNPPADLQQGASGVQETNPLPGEDEGVSGSTDQGEAYQSDDDVAANEPGGEGEQPAATPETAEVEFGGKKYVVPKALEAAILKDADYTQKTQQLAQERQAAQQAIAEREQQLAQQAQLQQTHFEELATLKALDGQVQQLSQFVQQGSANWHTLTPEQQLQVQQANVQLGAIREQRMGAVQRLQQAQQQLGQQAQQQAQQAQRAAVETVRSIVSQWSPDVTAAVNDLGASVYGVQQQHFQFFAANPGLLPILRDAVLYQQAQKRAASATAKAAPKAVQSAEPTPTLPSGGGSGTVRSLNDPAVPMDEWMKRRRQQLSKARSR